MIPLLFVPIGTPAIFDKDGYLPKKLVNKMIEDFINCLNFKIYSWEVL